MFQKLAVLSYLVIFTTCTVLHQPIPWLDVQYHPDPNYNFAYDVNDPHTGDIKNQHESRRGDTVVGEYSLVQPDGVRRTVEYRADDHAGFRATVNNERRPVPQHVNPHVTVEEASQRPVNHQGWDAPQRPSVAVHQQSWDTPQRSTEAVHQQSWDAPQRPNVDAHQQGWIPWPTPAVSTSPAPAPVAVSVTSFHQTIANVHHPWI